MRRRFAAYARLTVEQHLVDHFFFGFIFSIRLVGGEGIAATAAGGGGSLGRGCARFVESEALVEHLGAQGDGVRVGLYRHVVGAGDAAGFGQFLGFAHVYFLGGEVRKWFWFEGGERGGGLGNGEMKR